MVGAEQPPATVLGHVITSVQPKEGYCTCILVFICYIRIWNMSLQLWRR